MEPPVSEPEAIANARRVLGAHLAACRRAAGLSQQELADEAGFSRSAIGNAGTIRPHATGQRPSGQHPWPAVREKISARPGRAQREAGCGTRHNGAR